MPVMGKAVCTNCSPQLVYVIGPLCSILLQSTHQKICKGIAHSTRDCYQCIITPPLPQGLNISSRAIGELRSCSPAFVRQESSCRGGDRSGGGYRETEILFRALIRPSTLGHPPPS